MNSDFEVLPIGSTKELIELRKFAKGLIELKNNDSSKLLNYKDFHTLNVIIDDMSSFYDKNKN